MRVDDYCRNVIRSTKLPLEAQAVLRAIAYYVNWRTGETWVALPTVADDIGLSLSQTRHWAAVLREAGVFNVESTPGRPNLYRFPLHPSLSTPRRHTGGVAADVPVGYPAGTAHPTPPVQPPNPAGAPAPNHKNHVRNQARAPLRAQPRAELLDTGLYDAQHWEAM